MSTCIKYVAAGLLGGALTMASNSAAAQSAPDHRIAQAEALVARARALLDIGAGALFGALARNADNASTCVKGVVQCTPSRSSGVIYTDAATVSYAIGGALLATGVTLFVLAPSADKQERHALRVAARYASSGGRLQLEGGW